MANRYYVAVVTGPVTRWTQIVDALGPVPGRRQLPHQLIHWRNSINGNQRIFQAETNDSEHAYLVSLAWVTYLGLYDDVAMVADPAVVAYLATNTALWNPVVGG